ncbi:rhoptry-associated protein 1 [Babesia caballi]|uniref:Rhoptry-associated protein 1 n=1 Tax=Babesia caballi TaxID=5871 RepID=A0AAV4LSZ5_BABCB|nr:rhoptry-associated protein 1 [Babesia caballi]
MALGQRRLARSVLLLGLALLARVSLALNHTKSLSRGTLAAQLANSLNKTIALISGIDDERIIAQHMMKVIERNNNLAAAICARFAEKRKCTEAAKKYLSRCKAGNCVKLDEELHPAGDKEANIHLPNTYQLEAMFHVFDLVIKDFRIEVKGEKRSLNYEMKSNFYRILITSVMLSNTLFKNLGQFEVFLSRYLYMATLYYKTYTTLEPTKTKLQNTLWIARFLCGRRIRRTFRDFVKRYATGNLRKMPSHYVVRKTADFADYMMRQKQGLDRLAVHFADTAIKTLVKTMQATAARASRPWYVKLMGGTHKRLAKKLTPEDPNSLLFKLRDKVMGSRHTRPYFYDNFVDAPLKK